MSNSDPTQPMTELQAVNLMLRSINRVPAVSLIGVGGVDRDEAIQVLRDTSREVQERGWWFNEEICYPLQPNAEDELLLPNNTMKVNHIYPIYGKDLVERGRKLYDREGHTFAIGEKAEVDIVVGLPFADLPQAAKWYVTVKAARRFAINKLPTLDNFRFASKDETEALNNLEQAEAEGNTATLKNKNPHVMKMRRR